MISAPICAVAHFFALGLLSLNGLHRIWMMAAWSHRNKEHNPSRQNPDLAGPYPIVTVQLLLYNERLVAERLIDAVSCLDDPLFLAATVAILAYFLPFFERTTMFGITGRIGHIRQTQPNEEHPPCRLIRFSKKHVTTNG
jgi:hypothetical protein